MPRKRKQLPKSKGSSKRMLRTKKPTGDKLKKRAIQRRNAQLWTIESGLTYSSLSKWLSNPEEFVVNFMQGWTPRRLRKSMEFGSIFHLMLEHQFTGRKKSPTTVANQIAKAYENTRSQTVLINERETLHVLVEQCRVIFPLYCDWWKDQDEAEDFEWIAREQKFSVPYELVDHKGKTRSITLRGMRDGLYKDSGGYGVFETKTRDSIDAEAVRSQLRADMQTLLYLFTASKELGVHIPQVLYNIIRRPGQRRTKEGVSEFIKRCQKEISLKPEHYFKRWHVEVDKKDYENFENRTLLPAIRNFLQWYDSGSSKKNFTESPFHCLNLNALVSPYGKSEYWDLIINGRRSLYYQRSSAFPELEKSILNT